MFNCNEAYELICECIDRKDKFAEFETIFGQNKNNTKTATVNTKTVKQEESDDEVKRFASNFYKAPIINYKGYVNGAPKVDKNRYSEVISSTLLSKNLLKAWTELEPVRTNHFDTDHTHSEKVDIENLQNSNRKEEILAKLLFYQREVVGLGYIFDYQTPLKETRNDSYGKIDLLGYNKNDKCYSVIELKYRPSGSEETLLRCVLEAYTYYKLLDLKQIKSDGIHEGIKNLKGLSKYKHTDKAELVILFDEKTCVKADGGENTNLMLRIVPKEVYKANYPSKTVESQQYKECKELMEVDKRKQLRTLCENILKQEPELQQIRFVVLRTGDKFASLENVQNWSSELDRLYRAETLITITREG